MTAPQHIERAQVEASLQDLFGEGERTMRQYAAPTIGVAGALSVLALTIAFLLGRRRGRRRASFVEIRRI
jgi:hypothetical protein